MIIGSLAYEIWTFGRREPNISGVLTGLSIEVLTTSRSLGERWKSAFRRNTRFQYFCVQMFLSWFSFLNVFCVTFYHGWLIWCMRGRNIRMYINTKRSRSITFFYTICILLNSVFFYSGTHLWAKEKEGSRISWRLHLDFSFPRIWVFVALTDHEKHKHVKLERSWMLNLMVQICEQLSALLDFYMYTMPCSIALPWVNYLRKW